MTTPYKRGYETERKIVNGFRDQGYVSFRSAGSHSPVDVVVIKPDEIMLIQAKRTKTKYNYTDRNLEKLKTLKVHPGVTKWLYVWQDYKGFVKKQEL